MEILEPQQIEKEKYVFKEDINLKIEWIKIKHTLMKSIYKIDISIIELKWNWLNSK